MGSFKSTIAAMASLALISLIGSCAQLNPMKANKGGRGNLTPRETELIRQELVAQPLPKNPSYIVTRQTCLFFAQHPEDKSMIPVGLLDPSTYLVLRRRDGDWVDVQLTGGQLGSVVAANIRDLTRREDTSKSYLEPQPDLQPLTLPQASASTAEIDPVLLGG